MPERLKLLMAGLNMRGYREAGLCKSLKEHHKVLEDGLADADRLKAMFQPVADDASHQEKVASNKGVSLPSSDTQAPVKEVTQESTDTHPLETFFIDSLLYLEERIFTGSLGKFKVRLVALQNFL